MGMQLQWGLGTIFDELEIHYSIASQLTVHVRWATRIHNSTKGQFQSLGGINRRNAIGDARVAAQ
jgi:hypothetical protein